MCITLQERKLNDSTDGKIEEIGKVKRIVEDITMMIVTSIAIASVAVIIKMLISYVTKTLENGEYPMGTLHIVCVITLFASGTIITLYVLFITL